MHILIAPDSFKESLSAFEVATAIREGFQKAIPAATFDIQPVGDGGEGTLDALVDGLKLNRDSHIVTGAFGNPVSAQYARKDNLAVFEMASICGLEKIPIDKRDPLTLTTKGVGEMIVYLVKQGVTEIMLGVGGSATNDGGIGMAEGLGYEFFDKLGNSVKAVGENLDKMASFSDGNLHVNLNQVTIKIISDVKNPLCGSDGATYVFAGQKGLESDKFAFVDKMMREFYQKISVPLLTMEGAGAGGGMAAGLVYFANGQIVSGIDAVLDALDFDHRVKSADLVIIGEGRMDNQSLSGKAPIGVSRRTPKGIPIVAICGSLKNDLPDFPFENIQAAFPIIATVDSLENTLAFAKENVIRTANNIGNLLLL